VHRNTRHRTAVACVLSILLLGTGTSVAGAAPVGPGPGTVTEAVPQLAFAACGTTAQGTAAGVQCAAADLPLDYDEPDGERVQIAVARVPATNPGQRIGSLFFDLGGPGASSVDLLQAVGAGPFATLNQRFDIVGFDPRGVGQSAPSIDCRVDQETEGLRPRPSPVPIGLDADAVVARAQRYVDACLAANGDILEHVSTANVARDMDALRAAVGDQQLTYLGFSYGTFLGATYAALFPDRYRALVLDGPLDPQRYIDDPVSLSSTQLAAFERALNRFFVACAADQNACAGFGGNDPRAAYDALLATAAATPVPADRYTADPRPVSADDIRDSTAVLLYSKRTWALLAAALAQAASGDGAVIRALVDLVLYPRRPDGSFDPQTDRFFAISAGEQRWPIDVDAYLERGAREWVDSPHFWGTAAYSEIPHALWPKHDEDAYGGPFTLPGSSPTVLVVATTYDPATPYSGGPALVRELGNARLLTMDGDGHTAYGQGNSPCVDSAAESYLIDGTLPAGGTVCQQEVPFAPLQPAPAAAATLSADAVGALAGNRR
jgi:pimeloyl-ACP methyl ester carboxylesterase